MATTTYAEQNLVEAYSTLFRNLSEACRSLLREQLAKPKQEDAQDGFALSFGGWEGSEQTPEEIAADIRAARR